MTTTESAHYYWVREVELIDAKMKAREAGLRDYMKNRPSQGNGESESDIAWTIDNDTLMITWDAVRQRAIQKAIMYGVAVLIERS